jgi:cytochrome c oxidase cbb3-type subunit 2
MNRAAVIYVGVLLTVIVSFAGLVSVPQAQLSGLQPVADAHGNLQPQQPAGGVLAGRDVYIGLGCLYCHSQQVRPEGFGADLQRGWGLRRSVARDYIFDAPVLLGTMRTGPDLADIAVRQPSANWHYLHLYDPRITSPSSTMPSFAFLFERTPVRVERPADALQFPPGRDEPGVVVVPGIDARMLVAYLLSLDHSYAVPEAQ